MANMWFRRFSLNLMLIGLATLAGAGAASADEDGPKVNGTFVDSNALPQPQNIGELVEQAIQVTCKRRLTAGMHTPWQIVHGILAQRWDFMLLAGKGKEEVNAIEWIASGQFHEGQPLWEVTPFGGRGHPFTK